MSIVQTTIYLKTALEQWQQEIVRRKQVEEELRAIQERFQYLISSNPAIIYSCNPHGNYPITFVSENSKDILGYTTQEWLAAPKFWVNRIHPEDAPRIVANLSLLFNKGYHAHEYRFLHQDGTYRWLRDERKLVRDQAGNPLEMIGYIVDISVRKQLEQELQASQQKYKTLFEILPIGFSITDKVGNLLEANPALEEMLGRWGDGEMGRWGDGEMGRHGDGEMGRHGDGETRRWGDTEMGRHGDGEMGRRGDGEMGRWGDEGDKVLCTKAIQYQHGSA
ncbi:MAG: PAS domain-containing protein, partial [Symploca sp. SIO3E6]|nr:PAS domain-containing protein [Caldora sp. SIO3E6]